MPRRPASGTLVVIERNPMSLTVIFVICAAMIIIGIASNVVTR